jgi:amino acid adenylation domain-containing protein
MRSVFARVAPPALNGDEPTTLVDLFVASRRDFGGRPALWVDGCTVTYSELDDAARRLSTVIREARGRNIAASQLQCGLLVGKSQAAYIGVLASLMAGSAYVPLNTKFPPARLHQIIGASAIDTIIVDRRSIATLRPLIECFPRPLTVLLPDCTSASELGALPAGHRIVARPEIESTLPAAPAVGVVPEDGAYLLFTSGSTGAPKGVLVSHGNAMAYIANTFSRYRPCPDDRFSQLFEFSFDLSVHDMFLAWSAGACLCAAPEGNLAGLSSYIRKSELTFWFSVPSAAAYMRQLRMLAPGSFPKLRWSLFCGEPLSVSLASAWQEAAPNSAVENLYGPTEATVAFTAYRLPLNSVTRLRRLQTVPIGLPLPGQSVVILDEMGGPAEDGCAGELYLAGSQVAEGYWRAPEETVARFQPPLCSAGATKERWYRTGDRAVMTKAHGLIFLGRIDRQTKINGHRIELLEVESAVRTAAGTDMVAAFAWPSAEGRLATRIACFVSRAMNSAGEIISHCREQLPTYMVPDRIFDLVDWPLTASGKTDYQALAALLGDQNAKV